MSTLPTAEETYGAHLQQTTLADCIEHGWIVLLTCSTCGYGSKMGASLDVEALKTMRRDMSLAELAARASFKCGHQGAWVDERNDPGATHEGRRALLATRERKA